MSHALQPCLPDDLPEGPIAAAVSGGGDSIAMLHLLHEALAGSGRELIAATVDHRLRPESKTEAAFVESICASLGVRHETLVWDDKPPGNLQDQARRARYRLLADWAARNGCAAVCIGHTRDDAAETFLMRLGRGSGIDGLAMMRGRFNRDGATFLRPLLHLPRSDLRAYLENRNANWIDDPSNEDIRFDRIRVRRALPHLAELGLTTDRIIETAVSMRQASQALRTATLEIAKSTIVIGAAGEIAIQLEALKAQTDEIRFRILSAALQWISGEEYRPRFKSLVSAWERLGAGKDTTLHGCQLRCRGDQIHLLREPGAVPEATAASVGVWDRWRVSCPTIPADAMLAALGETGLATAGNWRDSGIDREALMTTPGLWRGDELLAAPALGFGLMCDCRLVRPAQALYDSIGPVESD